MYKSKLLDEAYSALKLSLIGVLVNTTVFFYIFYNHTDNTKLSLWAGAILLISAFRIYTLIKYKRDKPALATLRWQQLLGIGILLSAISWGITPVLFFIPQDYMYQMVIIVILAGLSAGSISSLSQIRSNIQLFLVVSLLPLIAELLLQATPLHNSIALLVTLYLALLLIVANKFNKNYVNAIKTRLMYEQKTEELLESEQKFETIFQSVPIGVFFYNQELVIQEINPEFVNFLEAPREFLLGLNLNNLPDQRLLPALKAPLDGLCGFYEGAYKTVYIQKNLWITMSTSALRDKKNNIIGAVGIVADITQRINTQQTVEHQANFDALTDIPNRTSLLRDIDKEIVRFQRHQQIFGILFLDLDHFKNINDSLGHDIGDKLLIETALRLKTAIRLEDTVARIGGDEFIVLLPDLTEDENIAATKAEHVAQKIHEILEKPFTIEGYTLNISSSIGITLISDNNESADDLLKHADIAMYQAKKEGRNTSRFYQEKMDLWVKRRLEIENELRNAIENHEFTLHYQPIIEFASSFVVGGEALLRWKNPRLGEVFPDEFIPIAEESGLIIGIGEWVLQTAVEQFVAWQKQFPHITTLNRIAVNVSVNQFNSYNFLNLVRNTIERYAIDPHVLELELTESIIAKDINLVSHKMQALREMGIKLSIDDFGTGYSSLSYLKKLPFTTLKIDKSFTQEIDNQELISTIITIAENFNLEVIIEGVETLEQYRFVNDRKATYMQGYYCSKPMEQKSFEQMLQTSNGICSITSLVNP